MPFRREGRPACLESGYQMCPHTQGLGSGLASRTSRPLHSQPRVPAPADEALGLGNWRAGGVAHLLILHCIRRGELKGLRRWVSSGEETGFSTSPLRITGDAAGGTPFVQEGRASPDRRRAGVPGGFLEETSCDLSLADSGGITWRDHEPKQRLTDLYTKGHFLLVRKAPRRPQPRVPLCPLPYRLAGRCHVPAITCFDALIFTCQVQGLGRPWAELRARGPAGHRCGPPPGGQSWERRLWGWAKIPVKATPHPGPPVCVLAFTKGWSRWALSW